MRKYEECRVILKSPWHTCQGHANRAEVLLRRVHHAARAWVLRSLMPDIIFHFYIYLSMMYRTTRSTNLLASSPRQNYFSIWGLTMSVFPFLFSSSAYWYRVDCEAASMTKYLPYDGYARPCSPLLWAVIAAGSHIVHAYGAGQAALFRIAKSAHAILHHRHRAVIIYIWKDRECERIFHTRLPAL